MKAYLHCLTVFFSFGDYKTPQSQQQVVMDESVQSCNTGSHVSSVSSPSPLSHHFPSYHASKRICASGCRRVLGNAHNDPYTMYCFCVRFCDVYNRCLEWSPELVCCAHKYQQTLHKSHEYKAKRKVIPSFCQFQRKVRSGNNSASLPVSHDPSPSLVHPGSDSSSMLGSVEPDVKPDDSVFQLPSSSCVCSGDMSAFFKGFASFLSLPDGS